LKRVLIVEDDLIIALSTEKMVEKMGYQVIRMVSTGEEAVQVALELNPDVILMDIRLAGQMDGIDATFMIKKELKDVRVIYISGNADPAYREKAQKSGYEAFLVKPVRYEELKNLI
jgi:two-component system, response regulator PdtaR